MALAHTVTPEAVAKRAGLRGDGATAEAERVLALAEAELEEALEEAFRQPLVVKLDEMVLRVASDFARAGKTSSGQQGNQVEGSDARPVPRDPLSSVRAMLARYVLEGLA